MDVGRGDLGTPGLAHGDVVLPARRQDQPADGACRGAEGHSLGDEEVGSGVHLAAILGPDIRETRAPSHFGTGHDLPVAGLEVIEGVEGAAGDRERGGASEAPAAVDRHVKASAGKPEGGPSPVQPVGPEPAVDHLTPSAHGERTPHVLGEPLDELQLRCDGGPDVVGGEVRGMPDAGPDGETGYPEPPSHEVHPGNERSPALNGAGPEEPAELAPTGHGDSVRADQAPGGARDRLGGKDAVGGHPAERGRLNAGLDADPVPLGGRGVGEQEEPATGEPEGGPSERSHPVALRRWLR